MKLNLNHSRHESATVSNVVNAELDRAHREVIAEWPRREYLGASSIGQECLRRIQLDWTAPAPVEPRTQRIFARGHWGEDFAATALELAGFTLLRGGPLCEFSQADGRFCGHIDGRIEAGPAIAGMGYPCLWEAKTLGAKGWRKLAKDGLRAAYPAYYSQVALYQAYCDLWEHPALFTALCADTMDFLHILVPFDAAEAQRASDRAVTVLEAVEAGETLPRISDDPGFWLCQACGHRRVCHAY